MTRFSKFNAEMDRYYAYKDELRWLAKEQAFELPDQFHAIFHLPMPKSWSNKKRVEMNGTPHQQKPDASNLLKALEDALMEGDEAIWDARATKFWAETGAIVIFTGEEVIT